MQDRGWRLGTMLVAAAIVAPVIAVLIAVLSPRWEVWQHLVDTRLLALSWNTVRLLAGVAVGTALLGVGLAWLVTVHRFPGRRLFAWLLLLPLAMPAYVVGFVAVATLDHSGPVQYWLRDVVGYSGHVPAIRSWGGVVIVMSLAFYPYVYLLSRVAFAERAGPLLDAARSLGQSPRTAFWRLSLPLARPAIAAGLALALMETLGDFGTVAVFGYDAYTTAIYRVWFGMFDRVAAGQLALLLTGFAALLLWAERASRGRMRTAAMQGPLPRLVELGGVQRWLASGACTLVLTLALLLPVGVLISWAWQAAAVGALAPGYGRLIGNTATVAVLAAVLVTLTGLLMALARRLGVLSSGWSWLAEMPVLGYAMPGSVVAVGVLLMFEQADNALAWGIELLTGTEPPLLILATMLGLLFAYLVRFTAVSRQAIASGLDRIPVALDEAARSLGAGPARMVARVHLPLLKRSLLAAAILVSVEVIKEMPMTMLIRPFGFETLAVEVWLRTTEAMWLEAAPPSLAIVLTGALLLGILQLLQRPAGLVDHR